MSLITPRLSTSAFDRYYAKLVYTLPMNDENFIAALTDHGLLTDDIKNKLEAWKEASHKASQFLDLAIKSSVTSSVSGRACSNFSKLLNVMENSNCDDVSNLAKLIQIYIIGCNRPQLKDLYEHVVQPVANKWIDIGVQLLHPTLIGNKVLKVIEADHPHSVEECCKSMFEKWLETQKDASWNQLFAVITAIGLHTLASKLEKDLPGIHNTTASNGEESISTINLCAIDASRLKERYLKQPPICKADWPKHKVYHYVRLVLVEKEDEITLKDEPGLEKKQSLGGLKDIFYYKNEPCPRLILIIGGPGMGKTTIAHEICKQWAENRFLADDFDAVILLPLRSVQQRSLEKVIIEHVGEDEYLNLKKCAGSRCLFILEGLDEMAVDCQQSDTTFRRLVIEFTLLEKARIVITSRPQACKKIVADRRVELMGFGNDEIGEFVEKSFPNDAESSKTFMRQLNEHPHLYSLCFVPLYLVILTYIFQFSKRKLPSTLTELYRLFIITILYREDMKGTVKKFKSYKAMSTLSKLLEGLCKEAVERAYLLCRLAWYSFQGRWKDPKISFTESDLIENGIEITNDFGLLKAIHTQQLPIHTMKYSFLHSTVQEFFCSLYLSTLSQEIQLDLLTTHFKDCPNVMIFLCGLTGLQSNKMFNLVCKKIDSHYSDDDRHNDEVTAIKCIYESNRNDPSQLTSPFKLEMSDNVLLDYDCLCLSQLLSHYPVSQLNLQCCHIVDSRVKLLLRYYPNKNITFHGRPVHMEVLNLWYNHLTIFGLEDVIKIVKENATTLEVLNIGFNEIGDDGAVMISEELQHKNSLTKLSVAGCGMSAQGADAISKLLRRNCTLQALDLSGNNIGDYGISVIAEQLQHITTLTVLKCGFSEEGAIAISKILEGDECMIQELSMSHNNFGDIGIDAITNSISSKTIKKLCINTCGITYIGAESLAKLLLVNPNIIKLQLFGNDITLHGAHLILKLAVDNKACKTDIAIDNRYLSDPKVRTMLNTLKERREYTNWEWLQVAGNVAGNVAGDVWGSLSRLFGMATDMVTSIPATIAKSFRISIKEMD